MIPTEKAQTERTTTRMTAAIDQTELRLCLKIPKDGKRLPLPDFGEVTLGRAEDADLQLTDDSISRIHARIYIADQLQLEDLGSTNGSFVNAVRLAPQVRASIRPGEAFELGGLTLVLQGEPVTQQEDEWCAARKRIIDALSQCSGNQTRAAALLGVSRRTISTWMNNYEIPRPIRELDRGSQAYEAERARIIEALRACAGNQTKAAKRLGISRRTLVSRLVTHRIPRPRKPLQRPSSRS